MSWITFPHRRALVATVRLPEQALEDIPHQYATVRATPLTIFRHDYQTWRKLRARGMLAPSPLAQYEWPGRFAPMQHQRETVEHFITHDRCFCLDGLGTGKTLSAIWAADYLRTVGAIRRVLVIAPLSITEHVWERELFLTLTHRSAAVLKGDRERKRRTASDTRLDWLIVNPESLGLVAEYLPEVDLMIVDEFTKFKSVRAQRYKTLRRVASDKRLWLMSGTPAPQSPTDAYGPIRLVNPKRVSFLQFRDLTMTKVSTFKWVPRPEAESVIAEWMQPAIRHRREKCYDLPAIQYEALEVDLTAKQQALIKEFKDAARAEIEGAEITAANAAAVLTKILQVMAGGVYGTDAQGERITHKVDAKPYFDAVEEIVEQADTPVLVFVGFRSSATATADHLEKQGYRVGRVLGGSKNRSEIFDAFQNGDLDAIVAVPSTMSHGLTLTRSRVVLWASPPFSFETYEQANGRIIRKGQDNNVIIYHLIQNVLAKDLFHRLQSKEKLQTAVLNLIEGGL